MKPTTSNPPALDVRDRSENGPIPLQDCTNDELYSARAHAWSEVFASLEGPKNEFGQRLRSSRMSWKERAEYKQELIRSRGINEIEAELESRGLPAKPESYTRVSAGWHWYC